MKLIDFDAYFSDYLNAWMKENSHKYKTPEAMEEAAPEIYLKFLNTPADWLNGLTPGTYFDQYQDADMLCDWLLAYTRQNDVPVPDPLLSRLAELADEKSLLSLATDEQAPVEARMLAVDLLRQIESTAPLVDYLRWQVERTQPLDLLDNALDSLREMGQAARGPAKIAFTAAQREGKEALLEVLCDFPGDEDVFAFTLKSFQEQKNQRALFAGYLAKLEDDRALEALLEVAEGNDISYIDFIEIRSAIERLGSEAPIRDFSNDPTYRAMRQMQ